MINSNIDFASHRTTDAIGRAATTREHVDNKSLGHVSSIRICWPLTRWFHASTALAHAWPTLSGLRPVDGFAGPFIVGPVQQITMPLEPVQLTQ